MLTSLNPFSLVFRLLRRVEGCSRARSACRGFCRENTNAGLLLGEALILASMIFCEPGICQNRGSVIDGYENCTWQDNGNSITVSVDVRFKESRVLARALISRSVEMWSYDSDGKYHTLGFSSYPVNVRIDGGGATGNYRNMDGGPMNSMAFAGGGGGWVNANAFTAHITATFSGSARQAVSILAGNIAWVDTLHTAYSFLGERMGAAYLYPGMQGAGCPVIQPDHPPKPPKPPVTLIMIAPDWDLGELAPRHGEKRLTAMNDQLCFFYSDPTAAAFDIVIDADSRNGVIGGQYQLKNLDDSTQVVPYSLVLNNGVSEVTLPNQGKSGVRLSILSPTCFSPTFRTFVRPQLKPGSYMDVLTFTAVTKT